MAADSLRVLDPFALGDSAPDLELFGARSLSIVCFRYVPAALPTNTATLNDINQTILERLQLGGQTFLSSTVIDGTFWLRACVVNHRATDADVDRVTDLVAALGTALVSK